MLCNLKDSHLKVYQTYKGKAGNADSSRAPGLNSDLQGSVNVHRGTLLLVPQWQCFSSFVFYIIKADEEILQKWRSHKNQFTNIWGDKTSISKISCDISKGKVRSTKYVSERRSKGLRGYESQGTRTKMFGLPPPYSITTLLVRVECIAL